jgi:hypothetical protein
MKSLLFLILVSIISGCSTQIQNNEDKRFLLCQKNAKTNLQKKELDAILPIKSFDYYITRFCNDKEESYQVSAFIFKELIDEQLIGYDDIIIETPTNNYKAFEMVIKNEEKQDKLVRVLSKLQLVQNQNTQNTSTVALYYKQNNEWLVIKLPIWVDL